MPLILPPSHAYISLLRIAFPTKRGIDLPQRAERLSPSGQTFFPGESTTLSQADSTSPPYHKSSSPYPRVFSPATHTGSPVVVYTSLVWYVMVVDVQFCRDLDRGCSSCPTLGCGRWGGKDCPRRTAKEHPDPCLSLFVFVLPDRLA